jgi:hypothetical protein
MELYSRHLKTSLSSINDRRVLPAPPLFRGGSWPAEREFFLVGPAIPTASESPKPRAYQHDAADAKLVETYGRRRSAVEVTICYSSALERVRSYILL